jgi:hypothetical protein
MPLNQRDHGDQSWATLSEGWPETREYGRAKWVFCNMSKLLPYGSYVLVDGALRVETEALLKVLDENFEIVRNAIKGIT